MTETEPTWADERDDDWADTFTWHAAWATAARRDDILGWLAVVHQAVTDSGDTAEDLFGAPREAAETFARDLPAAQRAAGDLDEGTWSSLPRTLLAMTGWFVTGLGGALLVNEGWTTDVTLPGLAVLAAITLGGAALGTAGLTWVSGRPLTTVAWAAAALAIVVGGVVLALEVLDRDRTLASIPTVVLPVVGLLLLAWWWRLPEPSADVDDRSRSWPAERWLTRLEWLLRGRHRMPRTAARRLVAEARMHVAETGDHPFEVFGPPQVHALALADADLHTPAYRDRADRRWHLLFVVCAAAIVVTNVATDMVGWSTWFFAAAGVGALVLAVRRDDAAQ